MCLGRFVFGLRTAPFAELSQAHQWRWASNQRFAQDPALQYVGRGESSLDLPCRLAPEITGGYSNIKLLQTMANRGEPYILLRGNGEVLAIGSSRRCRLERVIFSAMAWPSASTSI